jgi:hypothetical protein
MATTYQVIDMLKGIAGETGVPMDKVGDVIQAYEEWKVTVEEWSRKATPEPPRLVPR